MSNKVISLLNGKLTEVSARLTPNFSFQKIEALTTLVIPENEQMFLVDDLVVEGELQIEGEVVVDDFSEQENEVVILPDDNFSYKEVVSGLTVTVPVTQQMIVDGLLIVEGQLNIEGEVSVIDDEQDFPNPPYIIESKEFYKTKPKKQFFSAVGLILDGYFENEGLMVIGA